MLSIRGLVLHVDKANVGKIVSKIKMTVNTNVEELDLKTTCRVCLLQQEPANLYCLFKSNKMLEDLSVASAILDCFGVELKQGEDLPNLICITCITSTLQCYTFKKYLKKCQEYLMKRRESTILKQNKITKNKKEDILESPQLLCNYLPQDLPYCSSASNGNLDHSHKSLPSSKNNENIASSLLYVKADHNYSKEIVINEDQENDVLLNSFVNEVEVETGNNSEKNKYEVDRINSSNYELEIISNGDKENGEKIQKPKKVGDSTRWWLKEAGPPYECQICGRGFGVRFRAFYMHARIHRIEKVSCSQCGKRFTPEKMKIHMRSHTKEQPYICDQCPARFSIEGNLKRHLRCHTGEKLYVCDLCGKAFTQSSSLQNHKQTHTDQMLFVCEYCGKTFSSDNSRRNHLYTHQNKTKSDQDHEDMNEKHTCTTCGKVFSKSGALRSHARTHTENKRYHCGLCLKIFYSDLNYQIHMSWHELLLENTPSSERKDWFCQFCNEVFIEKNALVSHILMHMERPFVCSTCGQNFMTKKGLLKHSYLHNGEKPFTCSLCDKKFRYAATLKQHFRIHTGEKPYKCDICPRVFAQQQQLMSHMLTHTGEKKYVCPYCGKAFALNGNLTVHKRRHTGETPFVCTECGRGFYDSSSLKKHRQGLHKINFKNSLF